MINSAEIIIVFAYIFIIGQVGLKKIYCPSVINLKFLIKPLGEVGVLLFVSGKLQCTKIGK